MRAATRVAQAGAIVYRRHETQVRILVVEARKSPGAWVFPKGHVEPGETVEAAALREVREEAGVEALPLLPMGALEFRSGDEAVRVEYLLARHVADTVAAETRGVRWCTTEEALRVLTHEDARRLLREALPFITDDVARSALAASPSSGTGEERFDDLLLAEFGHAAESLLHNEQDGEKRAGFFVAIAAGAGAVLAFVLGDGVRIGPGDVNPLVVLMLAVVLLLGYVTLVRIVYRNRATDGYKQGLHRVRRYFLAGPADARRAFLAFDPYQVPRRPEPSWRSIGRGGWLETVAAVESLLAGALAAMLIPTSSWWADASISIVAAAIAWALLMHRARILSREP